MDNTYNTKRKFISAIVWEDSWFVDLSSDEKVVWLYLLTNHQSNILGVYHVSLRRMSFDTGLDLTRIREILANFQSKTKVFLIEDEFLFLPNWLRHQRMNPSMIKGAAKMFQELKQQIQAALMTIVLQMEVNPFEDIGIYLQKQHDSNDTQGGYTLYTWWVQGGTSMYPASTHRVDRVGTASPHAVKNSGTIYNVQVPNLQNTSLQETSLQETNCVSQFNTKKNPSCTAPYSTAHARNGKSAGQGGAVHGGDSLDGLASQDADRADSLDVNRVVEVAKELGIPAATAIRFFEYYSGTGWKTKNGDPVRNWVAMLENWGKRDVSTGGAKPGSKQPDRTDNDFEYSSVFDDGEHHGS